jgi:hypothetical protein
VTITRTLIAAGAIALLAGPTSAGLLAEYMFNGDAQDTSGAGRHAAVYGAELTADRNGWADSAYAFDGAAYIQTPIDSNVKPLSFSVWFQADNLTGERSIVDSDIGGRYGHSLILGYQSGDGELDVQYHNGWLNTGYALSAGRWRHAAVVFADTIQLWIDGALIDSTPYAGESFDGSAFRLGRHNPIDPQWFVGAIDDVRFYDHALSPSEIEVLAAEIPEPATAMALLLAGPALLRRRR